MKAPKKRVFEHKVRGERKFVRDYNNLIRNASIEAGLLKHSDRTPQKPTPEMIKAAKDTLERTNVMRGGKGSAWKIIKHEVKKFDEAHKHLGIPKIWDTLNQWAEKNGLFTDMKQREREVIMAKAAIRLISMQKKKLKDRVANPNRNDLNGYKPAGGSASMTNVHLYK